MNALKVTFTIDGCMFAPSFPIHLDGLLAWARVQEAIEQDPNLNDFSVQHDLPLEKIEKDGLWCWKASTLKLNVTAMHGYAFTRRVNLEQLVEVRDMGVLRKIPNKIPTSKGKFKADQTFAADRHVSTVEAWCVGDKTAIERLLARITHIGARRKVGKGEVRSVTVELADEANQLWQNRIMPWALGEDWEPLIARYVAPYWDKLNKQTCFMRCV